MSLRVKLGPFATTYLVPPSNSFWKWSENHEAVVWTDGRTIAFRQELHSVIRHLAPRGLPRFGSILLLIAATRDSWKTTAYEPGLLAGLLGSADDDRQLLAAVLAGLDQLSEFEHDLAKTPAAKNLLAEVVFESSDMILRPADAMEIADLLIHSDDVVWPTGPSLLGTLHAANALRSDLKVLRPGLDRLAQDRLRSRRDIGLEELPAPADLDVPLPEQVRSLLHDLEQDDELAGLARAAQHLMAAVTLPRATSDPDELEMGGVSDVTNRGPLDRLLITELAHDDLTLAVRVATGEAMYLRREAPPRTPQRTRVLLMESGIRSWGVPRVFGCAAALAMAGTLDTHTDLHAFRASGETLLPVTLHQAEGLRAHLAALETEAHPGAALPGLLAEMEELGGEELEPVLIVTEDTAEDPDFQRALADAGLPTYFLATVDRIGRFRLLQRTMRGTKQIREARLDLESLFANKRAARSVVDGPIDQQLPAIFAMRKFPLRLPHPVDPNQLWSVGERGILTITRDRRLMWWDRKQCGAIQLSDHVPAGELLWNCPPNENGVAYALVGNQSNRVRHVVRVDLDARDIEFKPIDMEPGGRGFCHHNGALFVTLRSDVEAYSLETAERLPDVKRPSSVSWLGNRYFRGMPGSRWWALAYDGIEPRFEFVLDEKHTANCPTLLRLFDKPGVEGPIGITADANLYFSGTNEIRETSIKSAKPIEVDYIATDGSEVVVKRTEIPFFAGEYTQQALIRVDDLSVMQLRGKVVNRLAGKAMSEFIATRSLRHRFIRIARDEQRRLVLTSRKGIHLALSLQSPTSDHAWLKLDQRAIDTLRESRTFKEVTHDRLRGIRLTMAEWEDGSKAFLDSRGLLHLKSSCKSVPEITLALCEGALSGWCSDGRLFGDAYFLGDHEKNNVSDIYHDCLDAFCEELT